jgi:hypothetical protein
VSSDERHVVVQFFCDTVTEMARWQSVSGSPLRTLSLLLARGVCSIELAIGWGEGVAALRVK